MSFSSSINSRWRGRTRGCCWRFSGEEAADRRCSKSAMLKSRLRRRRLVRDRQTLSRIKSLVIPPAWEDVWICPDANGHIQAVGRDERGRKQYLYHARWREVRDQTKYHKLILFARALPKIRRTIRRH